MDKDELFSEEVSQALKHKTMVRVRGELDKNKQPKWDWNFIRYLGPVAFATIAATVYLRHRRETVSPETHFADDFFAAVDVVGLEEFEDLELLIEVADLEDLELMEDWDGRDDV